MPSTAVSTSSRADGRSRPADGRPTGAPGIAIGMFTVTPPVLPRTTHGHGVGGMATGKAAVNAPAASATACRAVSTAQSVEVPSPPPPQTARSTIAPAGQSRPVTSTVWPGSTLAGAETDRRHGCRLLRGRRRRRDTAGHRREAPRRPRRQRATSCRHRLPLTDGVAAAAGRRPAFRRRWRTQSTRATPARRATITHGIAHTLVPARVFVSGASSTTSARSRPTSGRCRTVSVTSKVPPGRSSGSSRASSSRTTRPKGPWMRTVPVGVSRRFPVLRTT